MPTLSERPHPSDAVSRSPPIRRPIGRSTTGGWSLDEEAFAGLLRFLDLDRDLAAARYEDVRGRLLKLFAWRGCTCPEEYADRTIDRVARRLADGADISVADPYQYFHGVALNLLREHGRERARQRQVFDSVASEVAQSRALVAADEDDAEQERAALDRTLACLEACLKCLPARTRSLLIAYHTRPGQIGQRQRLAASLGISINALRTRVHRIRAAVERCVTDRIVRLELKPVSRRGTERRSSPCVSHWWPVALAFAFGGLAAAGVGGSGHLAAAQSHSEAAPANGVFDLGSASEDSVTQRPPQNPNVNADWNLGFVHGGDTYTMSFPLTNNCLIDQTVTIAPLKSIALVLPHEVPVPAESTVIVRPTWKVPALPNPGPGQNLQQTWVTDTLTMSEPGGTMPMRDGTYVCYPATLTYTIYASILGWPNDHPPDAPGKPPAKKASPCATLWNAGLFTPSAAYPSPEKCAGELKPFAADMLTSYLPPHRALHPEAWSWLPPPSAVATMSAHDLLALHDHAEQVLKATEGIKWP